MFVEKTTLSWNTDALYQVHSVTYMYMKLENILAPSVTKLFYIRFWIIDSVFLLLKIKTSYAHLSVFINKI